MRILLLSFLSINGLACCTNNTDSSLDDEGFEIGVFDIPAGKSSNFTHQFSNDIRIGFTSDISWEESERVGQLKAEDGFMPLSAIYIIRPSDDFGLGSDFGASAMISPEEAGESTFEIQNKSKEDLKVRVYWKTT